MVYFDAQNNHLIDIVLLSKRFGSKSKTIKKWDHGDIYVTWGSLSVICLPLRRQLLIFKA